MSIEASKWAWDQRGLSPAEKLVLLCLADHADEVGENCWPSQDRIARKAGIGRETVARAIKRFMSMSALETGEDAPKSVVGIIEVSKTPVPSMGALVLNKYKLLLSRVTRDHTGVTNRGLDKTTKSHTRVTLNHAPCDIDADFPCDDRSHYPSVREPSVEPSERERALPLSNSNQEKDLRLGDRHPGKIVGFDRWEKLEGMWREKGKHLSLYEIEAISLQLSKWRDSGHDPGAAVDLTILRGARHIIEPENLAGGVDTASARQRIQAIADGKTIDGEK